MNSLFGIPMTTLMVALLVLLGFCVFSPSCSRCADR